MQCLENKGVDWLELLDWGDRQVQELRTLGYCYLKEGRYERAEACFEVLVILCPHEAYDSQTLGALYLENDKLSEALARLNYALELDPSHLPTLLNRARTQLVLGHLEEGLASARSLQKAADPTIAGPATALILGYQELLESRDHPIDVGHL